ncbi:MAG: hypothetical protein OXU36_15270 [Candidatus Poribacteria bacterium]|nr:hypothetical protein [Candidatus Poribacteria bacterium]
MKNLMTRKFVFGMLMAFVLVFSVQGIADALELSATSDTTQVKQSNDAPFEIAFSVRLNGNAMAYNDASPRQRVTDANTNALRIDRQGYLVADVGSTNFRELRTVGDHSSGANLLPTGGTGRYLTTVTSPTSSHGAAPKVLENTDATYFPPPTEPYYVDTGHNVYDNNGKAVYIRTSKPATRTVDRTQNADGTVLDPAVAQTVTDYTFTRAKFMTFATGSPVVEADRFDYNEEAIRVVVPSGITVSIKGSNYFLGTGNNDLTEQSGVLKSSMTLVCSTTTANTYTIRIIDATLDKDFPIGKVPLEIDATDPGLRRSEISFTLHVTTGTPASGNKVEALGPTGDPTVYRRRDTGAEVEQINDDFTVTGSNLEIRYKILRGSGTLYAAETSTTGVYAGPSQDLTVHQSAHVFLNTNRTTNEVAASIAGTDRQTPGATIVYEYSGSDRTATTNPQPQPQPQPQPTTRTLSLSPTVLSGAPGTPTPLTATVSPAVAGVPVTFFLNQVALSQVVTNAAGQAQTTIILPASSGGSVVAAASGYTSATASISITGGGTPETPTPDTTPAVLEPASIEIYDGDAQQGEINRRLDEDLVVEVLDRNDRGVSFETISLRVVEGSGRFSPSRPRTSSNGRASFSFTPRSPGSQGTIEIEASVGDLSPVIFTVNVGEPPDAIVMVSGNNQSGRPGERLANPFVVEVVDENDDPVSGVTVSFRVTAGGGTLSATSATTNNGGRAQTTLTLGDEVGDNTVVASVSGLSDRVTFKARAGATVLVDASKRTPMYWVGSQNGTLHRLVDGEVEDLAPTVMGVTSIAVDSANGLLYFAVQTGPNKGTIRRSGLNGRNAQTLKKLTAVPMGIAVDSAGSTVYWTNSRGRIQSIAAQGSAQLTNLLSNLANPTAIALSNGHVYWGEPLGRIRRASLTGNQIRAENIATGLGEPLSLAIAKGKVYWIERDAGGGGRLQRANLDGSGIQQIKAFASGVPTSFAIDGSDNKIYWTRSTGKIQRSNLVGKFTTDIVDGLMGPGSIALGVAATPASVVTQTRQPTPTTPTQTTTPTTYSKYDVNRDGAVNNRDSKAVAGAQGQSGAGITNPRTDVDDSGTVDVTDLILVIANLDDDVAAPAIDVDLKAMDLDFDRIQEQVEMLLSSGDRSHAAQRALLYLQHLLASARPDATVLLANYPNPFNPETWIPYHLANSTDVKLRIYDARGILVRELVLGHQSAGYYTSRSRAAYWDGRNALGERVASGIYFYQLQADEISPLRKMVILK